MDLEASDTSIQPNPEQMDEELTTTAYQNVQENLKLPTEGEVRLEEPASSAGTLSSLQNLDKELSFTDKFLVEKSQEDELEKTNTESEVQSMVTVPIHQDTSSVPLMTTLVIDLTVSQPVSITIQASLPTSTSTVTAITTTTSLPSIPPQPQQGSPDSILIHRIGELEQHMADMVEANQALEERLDKQGNMLYNLENLDIPHKVSKAVDEIVTDAVDWAIQAPLRDRLRDLPESDMKEILHHRMWESNSYQAHEDHKMLYEALEKSMARDHTDQLLTDLAEARRKKRKRHASPKIPLGSSKTAVSAEYTAWTTTDTRLKPFVSSIPEELHMDDDTTLDEQTLIEERPATPEPAWSIPSSDLPVPVNNWASALASTYAPPSENSLLAQTGPAYEIVKVFHLNVIHLQYQMEECHKLLTDQVDESIIRPALSISKMKAAYYPDVGLEQMVPDQMWIEEECKYDYMKKIVLRRADFKEYTIAERDFKYLYPSDFEDLYLLNLQGHLNHLPPKDKKILTIAVNLWTRNLVIRQRVEDFQLGIESYQTQLNLTKPRWDATGFKYKHDFTVIESLRAVTFRDKYGSGIQGQHDEWSLNNEPGKLCWWKDKRGRLQTAEENRMITSSRQSRSISCGEILLKMNLPDHMSVLTDPEVHLKMEMEIPRSSRVNSQPHSHT
ncbi:hypothetical protein Tco_0571463 [Tanacetum coccineum]